MCPFSCYHLPPGEEAAPQTEGAVGDDVVTAGPEDTEVEPNQILLARNRLYFSSSREKYKCQNKNEFDQSNLFLFDISSAIIHSKPYIRMIPQIVLK